MFLSTIGHHVVLPKGCLDILHRYIYLITAGISCALVNMHHVRFRRRSPLACDLDEGVEHVFGEGTPCNQAVPA